MTNLCILALAGFFAFLSSSGMAVAQEKKPAERRVDKASPQLVTGSVTQADEKTKTVTISGKGGEKLTLNFSDPKVGACKAGRKVSEVKTFPKVGDNVTARADACTECLETC